MAVPAQILEAVHSRFQRHGIPDIRSGMTVKVHQKIKEGNKERVQAFEGIVIKVSSGHGADKSFVVRKVVDGIGVERIFPLHSANIKQIDLVKQAKVRRSKLYYLRNLQGKAARFKETYLNLKGKNLDKMSEEARKKTELDLKKAEKVDAEITQDVAEVVEQKNE